MDQASKEKVAHILRDSVDRTIKRMSGKPTHKPFHEALLTAEIVSASRIERSFSSSFGATAIEGISVIVAENAGYKTARGKRYHLTLRQNQEYLINQILSELRDGKQDSRPDWGSELQAIATAGGDTIEMDVTVDLWVKKGDVDCFYTLKTVQPDKDQTETAKKLMLRLKANDPSCEVYFALYYNPYGEERADYGWSMPGSIFNMQEDACVLIGKEYWENIGGPGVYEEVLEIVNDVSEYTQNKLHESGAAELDSLFLEDV